jgi:uncharacterized protein (TIGR02646 family)
MLANRPPAMECTYEALRQSPDALEAVENDLLAEQGGICAYTGHRISIIPENPNVGNQRQVDFHIEHLTPQVHCNYGQDADYVNVVACWHRPNCGFEPAYGAKRKGNWPPPGKRLLFVSPLRPDCSARFLFNHHGEIQPANPNDQAARTTIEKLGLQHSTLTDLRRQAIRGSLNPASRPIKLSEARKLLAQMKLATESLDKGLAVKLMPFCFAIEPALLREIKKLEGIMKFQ